MPRKKKHSVELDEEQREMLRVLVSKGEHKAREVNRGHILLQAERGKSDDEIADFLGLSAQAVYLTRRRFAEDGLEAAIFDKPRPPRGKLLDAEQEAHLIALTCSTPPDGREKWTVRLLTEKVVEMGIVDSISRETIRKTIKKMLSNRGRRKAGASQK